MYVWLGRGLNTPQRRGSDFFPGGFKDKTENSKLIIVVNLFNGKSNILI